MNIKTLEYIHALLIEKERQTKEDYRNARELQYEYEESETASESLIESQTKAADEYRGVYHAAADALEDFESQEW